MVYLQVWINQTWFKFKVKKLQNSFIFKTKNLVNHLVNVHYKYKIFIFCYETARSEHTAITSKILNTRPIWFNKDLSAFIIDKYNFVTNTDQLLSGIISQ